MNDNTKDLIDKIENENNTRAQLEQKIKFLKEEIKRLKFTIKEQSLIIEEQEQNLLREEKIPPDIEILKELIQKQREDLQRKEEKLETSDIQIQRLKKEVREKNSQIEQLREDLTIIDEELEELRLKASNKVNREIFENAQKIIEELTDVNLEYSAEVDALNSKITEMEEDNSKIQLSNQLQEANNRINQLKNRNEDLTAQINYLQTELDRKDMKVDTSFGNESSHKDEIKSYQKKLEDLEQKMKKSENKIRSLEERNSKLERKNQRLTNRLSQSREKIELRKMGADKKFKNSYFSLNKYSQLFLFERIFNLMDNSDKTAIINSLIEDLSNSDPGIRCLAVNILGNIHIEPVFNALIELKEDNNWIVRYHVAKALAQFEEMDGLKEIMKGFLDDEDVDIREIALSYLKKN